MQALNVLELQVILIGAAEQAIKGSREEVSSVAVIVEDCNAPLSCARKIALPAIATAAPANVQP